MNYETMINTDNIFRNSTFSAQHCCTALHCYIAPLYLPFDFFSTPFFQIIEALPVVTFKRETWISFVFANESYLTNEKYLYILRKINTRAKKNLLAKIAPILFSLIEWKKTYKSRMKNK